MQKLSWIKRVKLNETQVQLHDTRALLEENKSYLNYKLEKKKVNIDREGKNMVYLED